MTTTDDLTKERIGRGAALADWILANAAKQKFDLEAAVLKKHFTGGEFSTIPYGNTTVIHQAPVNAGGVKSLAGKVAPWLLGAALGPLGVAGGMALNAFLNREKPATTQQSQQGPIELPVSIDWKFSPNANDVSESKK